jgi:hypothetical protein
MLERILNVLSAYATEVIACLPKYAMPSNIVAVHETGNESIVICV